MIKIHKGEQMRLTTNTLVISLMLLAGLSFAEGFELLGVSSSSSTRSNSSSAGNFYKNKCFVGCEFSAQPTKNCAVACDSKNSDARTALHQGNHPSIVLGPTSWEKCAREMRRRGIPGW